MHKIIFFLIIFFSFFKTYASEKNNVIKNLKEIKNFSFNFEQNINGKIENGNCTIEYPKKILCKYNLKNKKILVSNGRSIVIKTTNSYYLYPIEKTPLNFILDKEFILNRVKNLNERIIDNQYLNFNFSENENEINLFFDLKTYNLIGWQTLDVYQNLIQTFLTDININIDVEEKIFSIQKYTN